MIAESGVTVALSSSPWNVEPLFSKQHQTDFYNKYIASGANNVDMDIAGIEAEIDRVKQHKESAQSLKAASSSSSPGTSSCTSVASSDCSDDAFIDVVDVGDEIHENIFNTADSDYISNSILNMLEEGSITDHVSLSTFEWTDNEVNLQVANNVEVSNSSANSLLDPVPSLPQMSRKRKKVADNAQWSGLGTDDKVRLVESLGQTISNELGLREQLDVIRIINPNAIILPSDIEFVIDIQALNDDKLRRIQDYIKRNHNNNSSCSSGSRSSQKSSDDSSSSECNSSEEQRVKTAKKQYKERKHQHKAIKQRQRKDYRQAMKEKRSGLFHKEEVLSLTIPEQEEEDDVDILS